VRHIAVCYCTQISVGVPVACVSVRHIAISYCLQISVGVSVALVLECAILLFVIAFRYLLVCL
jgi:hypothetical protein